MDNLMPLAWLCSFSGLALGLVALVLVVHEYRKNSREKKSTTRAKQLFPIMLIAILYFGWLGVPYYKFRRESTICTEF